MWYRQVSVKTVCSSGARLSVYSRFKNEAPSALQPRASPQPNTKQGLQTEPRQGHVQGAGGGTHAHLQVQGTLPRILSASHHQGRAAGDTGAPQGTLPGRRRLGRQGYRLLALRLVQRLPPRECGRESQKGFQILPHRLVTLLRRGALRAGARHLGGEGTALPPPRLAVRPQPQY